MGPGEGEDGRAVEMVKMVEMTEVPPGGGDAYTDWVRAGLWRVNVIMF